VRAAAGGGGSEVEGHEVLDQHFLLALAGPVVVDAEIPGHAGEPGREVGVAIELLEAAEDLEKDLLGQVLRVVMPPRELVADMKHLPLVAADDELPGGVVLLEAPLDQLRIGRGRLPLVGHRQR